MERILLLLTIVMCSTVLTTSVLAVEYIYVSSESTDNTLVYDNTGKYYGYIDDNVSYLSIEEQIRLGIIEVSELV